MKQEEIHKKTGGVVLLKDGSYDVDANTSMDQLSEEFNFKIPEVCNFSPCFISVYICRETPFILSLLDWSLVLCLIHYMVRIIFIFRSDLEPGSIDDYVT